ncbi:MAG: hypothetical protein HC933_18450, partial [Pleurocapsa sp. SU_196_0]|nr:hypothetical protein [Pleurocapsa sp. SU_196_0]
RAVAAAKMIVRLLNEQTADGYVFRTDLRLRPDPGVSAAAVSVNAAEAYYQSFGQNWERAAFIKARSCAGDIALGAEFIGRLRPFIWRKYLDFALTEHERQGDAAVGQRLARASHQRAHAHALWTVAPCPRHASCLLGQSRPPRGG